MTWYYANGGHRRGPIDAEQFAELAGATPGKMALGIRIVRAGGGGISPGLAVGRCFRQVLSGILVGIGYLMAAFDAENRMLHDRLCDTRVIRTR